MMYAVNDTFDDVRGGYHFHNKAVTNKSKNPQNLLLALKNRRNTATCRENNLQ